MNKFVTIYVEGEWDVEFTRYADIIVYDRGDIYKVLEDKYDEFIDVLESSGCSYLCLEKFTHPDWSGAVRIELK